ncbi:MAG: hypothetical protein C5B49_07485 [Bdellovibrio sp.]|nr:MAG: hypothetical protein C5B49_07485 [Bdellovibrio sp.]
MELGNLVVNGRVTAVAFSTLALMGTASAAPSVPNPVNPIVDLSARVREVRDDVSTTFTTLEKTINQMTKYGNYTFVGINHGSPELAADIVKVQRSGKNDPIETLQEIAEMVESNQGGKTQRICSEPGFTSFPIAVEVAKAATASGKDSSHIHSIYRHRCSEKSIFSNEACMELVKTSAISGMTIDRLQKAATDLYKKSCGPFGYGCSLNTDQAVELVKFNVLFNRNKNADELILLFQSVYSGILTGSDLATEYVKVALASGQTTPAEVKALFGVKFSWYNFNVTRNIEMVKLAVLTAQDTDFLHKLTTDELEYTLGIGTPAGISTMNSIEVVKLAVATDHPDIERFMLIDHRIQSRQEKINCASMKQLEEEYQGKAKESTKDSI